MITKLQSNIPVRLDIQEGTGKDTKCLLKREIEQINERTRGEENSRIILGGEGNGVERMQGDTGETEGHLRGGLET